MPLFDGISKGYLAGQQAKGNQLNLEKQQLNLNLYKEFLKTTSKELEDKTRQALVDQNIQNASFAVNTTFNNAENKPVSQILSDVGDNPNVMSVFSKIAGVNKITPFTKIKDEDIDKMIKNKDSSINSMMDILFYEDEEDVFQAPLQEKGRLIKERIAKLREAEEKGDNLVNMPSFLTKEDGSVQSIDMENLSFLLGLDDDFRRNLTSRAHIFQSGNKSEGEINSQIKEGEKEGEKEVEKEVEKEGEKNAVEIQGGTKETEGADKEEEVIPTEEKYIVKEGDTLSEIAKEKGIALDELLKMNPKLKENPNSLQIGQEIKFSESNPVSVESPKPSPTEIKADVEIKKKGKILTSNITNHLSVLNKNLKKIKGKNSELNFTGVEIEGVGDLFKIDITKEEFDNLSKTDKNVYRGIQRDKAQVIADILGIDYTRREDALNDLLLQQQLKENARAKEAKMNFHDLSSYLNTFTLYPEYTKEFKNPTHLSFALATDTANLLSDSELADYRALSKKVEERLGESVQTGQITSERAKEIQNSFLSQIINVGEKQVQGLDKNDPVKNSYDTLNTYGSSIDLIVDTLTKNLDEAFKGKGLNEKSKKEINNLFKKTFTTVKNAFDKTIEEHTGLKDTAVITGFGNILAISDTVIKDITKDLVKEQGLTPEKAKELVRDAKTFMVGLTLSQLAERRALLGTQVTEVEVKGLKGAYVEFFGGTEQSFDSALDVLSSRIIPNTNIVRNYLNSRKVGDSYVHDPKSVVLTEAYKKGEYYKSILNLLKGDITIKQYSETFEASMGGFNINSGQGAGKGVNYINAGNTEDVIFDHE